MGAMQRWTAPHGSRIAYRVNNGRGPGVVWMGGFRSDMDGGKASALHAWAEDRGGAFLRFDYSGHGASDGRFEDGSIGAWTRDAGAVLKTLTKGPQIVVGSSMGGWIALNLARQMPEKFAALILVAPAPDFTARLEGEMGESARRALTAEGVWMMPADDPSFGPTPISREFLSEARENFLLTGGKIPVTCPVRILQGMKDEPVPWRGSLELAEALESQDVGLNLIKDGDHRLSRPQDIKRIIAAVAEFCAD